MTGRLSNLPCAAAVPLILTLVTADAGSGSPVSATSPGTAAPPAPAEKGSSVPADIRGLAQIYRNDRNPFLQEFSLTGRYHGQYWLADAESGSDDDWEHRRFRLGFRALLLDRKLEVKAEMFSNLSEDDDPFYDGLTEAYIRYSPSKTFSLTVGKQKPKFSQDWSLSSRLIPTIERSALINQFQPDYASGISGEGTVGRFGYYAGLFSADTIGAGDRSTNFGDFDGGLAGVAGISWDFSGATGLDTSLARLDVVISEVDAADDVFHVFDYGVAGSIELKRKPWGLVSEVVYGHLDSGGGNWGLRIQPAWDITERLQFVARYQLGLSTEATGLRGQRRYERAVGGGDGDVYNAAYAGLNFLLYGQKAKLMTGVEYANMDGPSGYDGWTAVAGVRLYW